MIDNNLIKLVMKHAELVGALSTQTIQLLIHLWGPFRNWTDYDLGIAYAARSATTVESAMRATRQREQAYQKLIYKNQGISFPTPDQINESESLSVSIAGGVDIYPRNGVTPLEVWQRPMEAYRWSLSQGVSPSVALERALQRTGVIADTDLSLARRDEISKIYQATPKIKGYRRVIHPELSKDGMSCGLCVVASTRIYKSKELLPIHDFCHCDVLPIVGDNDPGLELNNEDLQKIYDAAGDNTAGQLLKTKVYFNEHGELGPVVSTSPRTRGTQDDRAKDRELLTPAQAIQSQLHTLRKSAVNLLARQQKGEDVTLPLQWQRDRISNLQRQLIALKGASWYKANGSDL